MGKRRGINSLLDCRRQPTMIGCAPFSEESASGCARHPTRTQWAAREWAAQYAAADAETLATHTPVGATAETGARVAAAHAGMEERADGVYAPFVATPLAQVPRVLELARVTSDDVLCDLGYGDGTRFPPRTPATRIHSGYMARDGSKTVRCVLSSWS